MPHEERAWMPDWLRIAEQDMMRVEILLSNHNPVGAGFYLQQAVEKFLKAYLISRGRSLRKIHDLAALLREALVFDSSLEIYLKPCAKITVYYYADRYPPFTDLTPSDSEIQEARDKMMLLINAIRLKINLKERE